MGKPEFLYHYTSVATLEKVLSSKKMKFNRLDRVDDLNEGRASDLGDLGMYIFISCWTDSAQESIPLWNEYSKDMQGIRIKLPSQDLFKTYHIESEPENGFHVANNAMCLVPRDEIHGRNYLAGLIPSEFLIKVQYTEELEKIIPKTSYRENKILFGKLGRYKRIEWKYQSEWRYKFMISPAPPPPKESYLEEGYMKNINSMTEKSFNERKVDKDYFLLKMRDEPFSKMEIMLGPKCDIKKDKVYSLVEKYNPEANIVESSLKGKIR